MTTIKLKVSEHVYEKFIKHLNQLKSEVVEIVASDKEFDEIRHKLQKDLELATDKGSKTYSIDEADELLEKTINKYDVNNYELNKEQEAELDRRIAAHKSGESKSYSWAEAKMLIKTKIKKVND